MAGLVEGPASDIEIDSVGTLGYHVGSPPDPRSVQTAKAHQVDISTLKCRKITDQDFAEYDYILAMDEDNVSNLRKICPEEHLDKIQLFLPFARDLRGIREVPDPYHHRDMEMFERVYDFIDRAADGLLHTILETHFPDKSAKG